MDNIVNNAKIITFFRTRRAAGADNPSGDEIYKHVGYWSEDCKYTEAKILFKYIAL